MIIKHDDLRDDDNRMADETLFGVYNDDDPDGLVCDAIPNDNFVEP